MLFSICWGWKSAGDWVKLRRRTSSRTLNVSQITCCYGSLCRRLYMNIYVCIWPSPSHSVKGKASDVVFPYLSLKYKLPHYCSRISISNKTFFLSCFFGLKSLMVFTCVLPHAFWSDKSSVSSFNWHLPSKLQAVGKWIRALWGRRGNFKMRKMILLLWNGPGNGWIIFTIQRDASFGHHMFVIG